MAGSASGPFGSNVASAASDQALSLVESDDEDSPFALFQAFNPVSSTGFRFSAYSASGLSSSLPSATFSFRYSSSRMAAPPPPPPAVFARSHATNQNDPTAGSRLENPLEIESDNDDDSDVEVVELD